MLAKKSENENLCMCSMHMTLAVEVLANYLADIGVQRESPNSSLSVKLRKITTLC